MLMFIVISMIVRKKPLYKVEGVVNLIEQTEISRKNNSTFDLKQNYHLENVIDIRINNESYLVETNFKSKWRDILDNIHVGETVLIHYIITEEGNSICQLKKNTSVILNYKELLKTGFYIKLGLIIFSVLILLYVLLLFFMRRNYLEKINNR
jgi:ATP-dependent Zn protease